MSLLYGHHLRAQVAADIRAAWPDVKEIVFGKPTRPAPKAPYVRVVMPEVEYAPHTVAQTEQRYVFLIGLVSAFPKDVKKRPLIDVMEERANNLIARLMASRTYSDLNAYRPMVNRVLFDEELGDEPTYEVAVEFECRLSVAYIVNDAVLDNSAMNPSGVPLGGAEGESG